MTDKTGPLAISIHALREEGDKKQLDMYRADMISIHALREEGDHVLHPAIFQFIQFLSTPSARRATGASAPVRAGCAISIHALREEGDIMDTKLEELTRISIHALREEGDAWGGKTIKSYKEFLSTPSARRATCPRSPARSRSSPISIHALREEGDLIDQAATALKAQFLSTPSARRATSGRDAGRAGGGISIHALREEGDAPSGLGAFSLQQISIHALREEGDCGCLCRKM